VAASARHHQHSVLQCVAVYCSVLQCVAVCCSARTHQHRWPPTSYSTTHSYVWHDSFICLTWPIHMCDMTHSRVCHDSFTRVPWFIRTCDMSRHTHMSVGGSKCVMPQQRWPATSGSTARALAPSRRALSAPPPPPRFWSALGCSVL